MTFVMLAIHSIINLMTITVERYLKVVHTFWSKNNLKRWMTYAAMVFAWVAGILSITPVVFVSTIVEDGICLPYVMWESKKVTMIFDLWVVFSYLVIPVIVFVFCYSRIVAVMRRQMKVMAAHNVEGATQMSASQIQSKRIKWNITKTMIIVSVAFVICWSPVMTYPLILDTMAQIPGNLFIGFYVTVFLSYLYICMNPFIYAFKHEAMKEILARLMACRKHVEVTAVAEAPGSTSRPSNIVVGTGQLMETAHE